MQLAAAVYQGPRPIVDTHCHYNLSPLVEDWRAHWQKAQEYGVKAAFIPGVNLATSRLSVEIASQDANLWAMVGIHPAEANLATDRIEATVAQLESLIESDKASANPRIIGVGEIGLDYFRVDPADQAERQRQWDLFTAQLALAVRHDLYVSLHVRDREAPEHSVAGNAYWDIVAITAELSPLPPLILHCVSGPAAYVAAMLARDAFVGFAGNVTFPNAQALRQIWGLVPPARRLIETDAPYLAPQAYRGRPCEPWMISATADYLATAAFLE